MIFVDTSYLLALVNPRDALHVRARAWAEVLTESLVVTEYVLWEFINAYSLPRDRPKAHAVLAEIRTSGTELMHACEELFSAGIQLHAERSDKEWSLTDCVSCVVMRRRGLSRALSYDHHFEPAGYEALLRREPAS
jgi:predicted nucleic acid-binding protein